MIPQIDICGEAFDPEARLAAFRKALGDCGAIVSFTGMVRYEDGVNALELSHFEGFTQSKIEDICGQAEARWALSGLLVIHRVGKMQAGEPIVLVTAAATHRREAFKAADYVMDYLKSEAPFWKKEYRADASRWIEPCGRDKADLKRWET